MRQAILTSMIAVSIAGCSSAITPTPNPNLTPAPLPDGWTSSSWNDPNLSIGIPGDWTAGDETETSPPDPSLLPEQQRNVDFSNEMASSGKTRLVVFGDVETSLGSVEQGSLIVYVEEGDASLAAFGDRQVALDASLVPGTAVARTSVVLPAGVALRLAYAGKIGNWPNFAEVDYLFRLPDGRSMTIAIAGSDKAASLEIVGTFAERVILTLRPTP